MTRLFIIDDSPIKLKNTINSLLYFFDDNKTDEEASLEIILCNVINSADLNETQKLELDKRHEIIDKIFNEHEDYHFSTHYIDIYYEDYRSLLDMEIKDETLDKVYYVLEKGCGKTNINVHDTFLIDLNLNDEDETRLKKNEPVLSFMLYKSIKKKLGNNVHVYTSYNDAKIRDDWVAYANNISNEKIRIYQTEHFEGDGFNETYAYEILQI